MARGLVRLEAFRISLVPTAYAHVDVSGGAACQLTFRRSLEGEGGSRSLWPGLLGDANQDQIPELQIVLNGIEFEFAVLKPDPARALFARRVERVEICLL